MNRPGFDRTDTPYAWPTALLRPPREVRLIYLDLNHWISLAKAETGHKDGAGHRHALDVLRDAGDQIVLPLTAPHYMEMTGITDPRQRFDIAKVMEELSGFACLMTGPTVMRLEFEAALAQVAGTRERFEPIPLVGTGALQAFGRHGGLRIRSPEGDVTEVTREKWPGGPEAFNAWRRDAELRLNRALLRGPTDEDVPELQAAGWDPTVARRTAEKRAAQEREQAERLAAEPRWRRGRLRDVVAGRYLALEAQPTFDEALAAHGLELRDVMTDPESARRFTDSCRAPTCGSPC